MLVVEPGPSCGYAGASSGSPLTLQPLTPKSDGSGVLATAGETAAASDGKGLPRMSSGLETRESAFDEAIFGGDAADIREVRRLASLGVPDGDPCLRATVWKLMLGYLPPERNQWDDVLAEKRAQYLEFERHVTVSFEERCGGSSGSGGGGEEELTREAASDDPLSTPLRSKKKSDSKWAEHFADEATREQISVDVLRTRPEMHFFNGESGPAALARQAEMRRALFVYAKLNPGTGYVQGMNELFAPLYYMFSLADEAQAKAKGRDATAQSNGDGTKGSAPRSEPPPPSAAEADAFFAFVSLMSEMRDCFVKQLDDTSVGVKALMARLMEIVEAEDPALHGRLEGVSGGANDSQDDISPTGKLAARFSSAWSAFSASSQQYVRNLRERARGGSASEGNATRGSRAASLSKEMEANRRETENMRGRVDPQFYAFRWITLALTQEFTLVDVVRLWDYLLAAEPLCVVERLLRLCASMLLRVKPMLVNADFPTCVKLLQTYPLEPTEELCEDAGSTDVVAVLLRGAFRMET